MTKLSNIHQLIAQLNEADKVAIIGLIDLKVEEDMDKVLHKLESMTEKFDARLDAMEQKFDARLDAMEQKFDARLDAMEQKFDARLDAIDTKFSNMIQSIRWWNASVIGFVGLLFIFMRYFPHV